MFNLDDRRFNRLALGSVLAGFSLLTVAFAAGLLALFYAQNTAAEVDHTHNVVDQLALIEVHIERTETAFRGYLVSQDQDRIDTYRLSTARLPKALDRTGVLVADNPVQVAHLQTLRRQIDDELQSVDSTLALAVGGDVEQARQNFAKLVKLNKVRNIRATAALMRAEEERLLAARTETQDNAAALARRVLLGAGLLLILIAIGATLLVRRYTIDLSRARDRLHLLNTDLESAVAERTSDLQRANQEIQRFAYIVSHDLRSPLVNVMGFTAELDSANWQIASLIDRIEKEKPDLVTAADRSAALEDLPEAVGFIRSSTQKMDRLINAILSLSRQGKRILAPQPLDMKQLITEVAHSLDRVATERGAHFVIEDPLPPIHHDRLAIEQILSNLMENATKYLAPGRPGVIAVRGKQRGARVRFEVEDNGRGIAPEDHERVFELFRRSGAQDQPGEGIGLANVRALAYRLGGTVTLRSTLGEGSTFIVDLPIEFAEEGKVQ